MGLIERVGINRSTGDVATAKGRSLEPTLEALYAWGVMRGKEVGARFRFERRSWVSGCCGRQC